MTSAQVVETSVTSNSSSQNYSHPDDRTIRTTDTPGFKPFTILRDFKRSCYSLLYTFSLEFYLGQFVWSSYKLLAIT